MTKAGAFLFAFILTFSAFMLEAAERRITFEERIRAQAALEKVFYDHRAWPGGNPEEKPPFEKAVPREAIIAKVVDCAGKTAVLKKYWNVTVTEDQLFAELERMAGGTKDPATLLELFSALGNDPGLIAECLARPAIVDKLTRDLYFFDAKIHSREKARAEKIARSISEGRSIPAEGAGYSMMSFVSLPLPAGEVTGSSKNNGEIIRMTRSEFSSLFDETPSQGSFSGVIEKEDRFLILHTLSKDHERIEYECLSFPKKPVAEWLAGNFPESIPLFFSLADVRRLPPISASPIDHAGLPEKYIAECVPAGGSWISMSASSDTPSARMFHTAVWTGAEMIVWGGFSTVSLNTGGRYYPSTDTWMPTSTGANVPSARFYHTAVWSGTRMVVWGGSGTNTGGRYDPLSDSWLSTSAGAGCPTPRSQHTAVWTGTEMIIWGGSYAGSYLNSGGKYNPSANTWTPTAVEESTPSGRSQHTALWTGSSMIAWGGRTGDAAPFNTSNGGVYVPSSGTWTPVSLAGCPEPRALHSAVWTGTEMIVWGGIDISGSLRINTGGRYDPSSDSWTSTSETDVPEVRSEHSAVWTENEMIVWGGQNDVNYLNNGGRYDPLTDIWTPTSVENGVPSPRCRHTAVRTDNLMIVWGGGHPSLDSGGIWYGSPVPPLGFANNSASDIGDCADEGVLVSWSPPSSWADNDYGTRSFDVLRDGNPVASGLPESARSFTDVSGNDGIPYLYQVRASSGCGTSSISAGTSASDTVGTIPPEVASLSSCSWPSVPGAVTYRLYRGTKATLPDLANSSPDGCIRYEGALTAADCSKDDPSSVPGRFFWYLVTAVNGTCEGSAGEGTGFTRDLSGSGNCSN